jgi:hypothetical protein
MVDRQGTGRSRNGWSRSCVTSRVATLKRRHDIRFDMRGDIRTARHFGPRPDTSVSPSRVVHGMMLTLDEAITSPFQQQKPWQFGFAVVVLIIHSAP